MKLWLSVAVAALISSQSVFAEGTGSHQGAAASAQQAGPAYQAPVQDPNVKLNQYVNACLLQQGATSPVDSSLLGGLRDSLPR